MRVMRDKYPHVQTASLVAIIGKTVKQIYMKANVMGLHKTAEYLASPDACRLRRGDNVGAQYRFKPGQQVWNKGIHFVSGGRSAETQFKKGSKPANYQPVGTTRIVDGYTEIKVAEGMRQWKSLQRVIWEGQHGPIPKGASIIFKDGNRQNCAIDNLEMLTRAELMKRNTVHNLPPELAKAVQLIGALNRKINHGKQY